MGLLKLLTKEIKLTSALQRWHEPIMFRVRLRNDVIVRLMIILGAWFGGSGLVLLLFATNVNPPGAGFGLGLGLLGAGIAFMAVLGRRGQVSGTCWIYQDKVSWQSTSAGLLAIQANWAEWSYAAIDKCEIVPAERLDKPFSVMLITSGRHQTLIGIPQRVTVREIAQRLAEMDVDVSMASKVPAGYTTGISFPVGIATSLAGLALLTIGLMTTGNAAGDRPRELVRPDLPAKDEPPAFRGADRPFARQLPGAGDAAPHATPEVPNAQDTERPPPFAPPGARRIRPGAGAPPMANPFASPPAMPNIGTDSQLLGGTGGSPFRTVSPAGQPVVGVQYGLGQWAGKPRVGRLTPLFERPAAGQLSNALLAPQGYALGAMQVDAGEFVDAVRLVFMRAHDDGSLNDQDFQLSDWIGVPNESNLQTISGQGAPVIGIHGRGAGVLDAVGLVFGGDTP